MPSGHAASAAAFAAGAALELPIAGIPLVAIAATVAYSRIYNGVHYPSDVLVGATVGAVIGLASKSLWPLIDDAPAVAKTIVPSGSREDLGRGDGSGLTVIVNSASHSGRGQGVDQEILAALPGATIELVEDASMLRERLVAAATSCVVLGIVGGDGSINTAAGVAIEYDIPLLAIPGGTLNHFTRDLGIDSIEEAMAAYRSGDLVAVDIGLFGEHPFLNTASVGIYSEVVRMRERYEARVGKWPSMMMALIVTMRRAVPLELEVDGRRMQVWTVFVGNCAYDPPGFAPATRSALDEGNLDVRIIDGARPYARARLLVALLTGTLLRTSVYERSVRASFTIKTAEPVLVSVDGEVIDDQATEFVVAKEPTRLKVFSAPRD